MRFCHEPLAQEIRQPLPTFTTLNKLTYLLTEEIGISWRGGGFCKTKKLKEMCEAFFEFPERWGGS